MNVPTDNFINTFDTLCFLLDKNMVEYKKEKFERVTSCKIETGEINYQNDVLLKEYKIDGFGYLKVTVNYVIIQISSKLLDGELITINNLERCIDKINDLDIVYIPFDKFLEHANIMVAHFTFDIHDPDKKYLTFFRSLFYNKKFPTTTFTNNQNILFKPKKREHLCIYDKALESPKKPQFKNITRIELKFAKQKQIKKALGVSTTRIRDIMLNKNTLILDYIGELTADNKILVSKLKKDDALTRKAFDILLKEHDNNCDEACKEIIYMYMHRYKVGLRRRKDFRKYCSDKNTHQQQYQTVLNELKKSVIDYQIQGKDGFFVKNGINNN